MADHLESPALERLASHLRYGWYATGLQTGKAALERLSEQSPHERVRAAAEFSLACLLLEMPGCGDGKEPGQIRRPEPGDPAIEQDRGRARALLTQLDQKHADLPYGQQAAGYLFELDHLQIGMAAPDFEAVDQDGVAFRLSDYRGKVVVLDFWGFW